MTGPEHYREAERLIGIVSDHPEVFEGMDRVLAAAQVHATLALAAATGLGATNDGMHYADGAEWDRAASAAAK